MCRSGVHINLGVFFLMKIEFRGESNARDLLHQGSDCAGWQVNVFVHTWKVGSLFLHLAKLALYPPCKYMSLTKMLSQMKQTGG